MLAERREGVGVEFTKLYIHGQLLNVENRIITTGVILERVHQYPELTGYSGEKVCGGRVFVLVECL